MSELNVVDEVTYKPWLITDRSTLESIIHSVEELLAILFEELQVLLRHSFVTIQQSTFQNELRLALSTNENIVCDFAKNYSFILHDEVRSLHWNNAQAATPSSTIYYGNADNTSSRTGYVIISHSLSHNTVAVYLYQGQCTLWK
jgi:hypothetical protein